MHDRATATWLGFFAFVFLLCGLVFSSVQLITARETARVERQARCAAEVALYRYQYRVHVAKLSALYADGGPNADCELAEAIHTWIRLAGQAHVRGGR
jgi:hypothetical protein